jgi:hypothetical protein
VYTFPHLWFWHPEGDTGMAKGGMADFWNYSGRNTAARTSSLLPFHKLHYMGGHMDGSSDNFP